MHVTPVEFVLWMNGAAGVVGDQPPTPEQWTAIQEKLGDAVGGIVAARLLERAEELDRADELRKAQAQAHVAMVQHQAQIDLYTAKLDAAVRASIGGLVPPPPPSIEIPSVDLPSPPKGLFKDLLKF